MSGPCPNGAPTMVLHKEARCRDRERCTGQGCRVRRSERVSRIVVPSADPQWLASEREEAMAGWPAITAAV